MVVNKHIGKIIAILMAIAVLACFAAMVWSDELSEAMGGKAVSMEYEEELFNTDEIISIDILMDEDEWEEMLSNAISEEYYVCDVVVNGVTFENVAIRPKGNTSLSSIAMDPETDRYSLKLEFDHFSSGQTCFGLDKLILNNNYADATNMKEAIVYDMYQYLGADASLYNYASVSVNGEYWGVYLALEGVEQSFMLRNYGTQDGELYKPDSMEMGGAPGDGDESERGFPGGSFGDFNPGDFDFEDMPDMEGFDQGNFNFGGGPGGAPGGFGERPDSNSDEKPEDFDPSEMEGFSFGGGGANLNYSDDDLDSYQTIWDGAITDSGDNDHKRVVKALKNISEGTDLEEYLDVDNILKYMAVHTFVVNMDSLSGSMAHNYYLYEYNGQLNIIPWDYNLSFGGMGNGGDDATSTINDAIDTPFSSTEFFDALLENEEYLEKYHEYLNMLVEEYVYGGRFDEVYTRIRNQIDSLVEADPTAFYEYDEFIEAADLLKEVIYLRAESVKGQLDGSIPSTDSAQNEDSSNLIDASGIDLSVMGTMNMGGGDEGGFGPVGDRHGESGRDENRPEREMSGGDFPGGELPEGEFLELP